MLPLGCAAVALLPALTMLSFWRPWLGIPLLLGALAFLAWRLRGASSNVSAGGEATIGRLAEASPPTGDAWRRLLQAQGLEDLISPLAERVRAAVRLTARPVDALPLGASRIGGTPDLPADVEWPRRRQRPMAFLAQIDLAEVARVLPVSGLPPDGGLWFFYDCEDMPWGYDPAHAGGAQVIYRPRGAPLRPVTAPAGTSDVFRACAVTLEAFEDPPELEPDDPLGSRLSEEQSERYMEVRSYLTGHRLLGYAEPVQGPMEIECEMVTSGIDVGHGYPELGSREHEISERSKSWRLLLQLDSDDDASMMWGDLGRLYFWIREDDLRARRFDRTWTILQCH